MILDKDVVERAAINALQNAGTSTNSPEIRKQVIHDIYMALPNESPVAVICDNTNNSLEIVDQRQLIVDVYFQQEDEMKKMSFMAERTECN